MTIIQKGEPMSDKDTIYRQDAIDALADYIHNVDKVMGTGHLTADDCKDAAASVFEDLPSAQTERKKGKWIHHTDWEHDGECPYECSVCGMGSDVDYDYCMRCGADMRTSE